MRYLQTFNFRYIVAVIFTIIFLSPVAAWSAYKTNLSDTHIQSSLARHFPIREYAVFARVTLHEPQVILTHDSKDLLLIIPIDTNIPDQSEKRGHARIAVNMSYKPENGGLYLINPRVIEFQMPQISNEMSNELKAKISTICMNSLPLVQIYKLKVKNLNHSLAKSALKSFYIEDGSISLVFGFD